ncbi:something about silencing protein 10-like [Tubulanus polymorphus]|uniref:something about silencing protein 10-like n=1 Tax=Tubulanus polymorphus TaxID=672921 RepID=UPI003DA2CD5E
MGKKRGKVKDGRAKVEVYDSDDERAYEKAPNPNAEDMFADDIDEFHSRRDKVLLDKSSSLSRKDEEQDEQEALMEFSDDDDGDDDEDDEEFQRYKQQLSMLKSHKRHEEMASDIEDVDDDDLLNDKAWGKQRSRFFGADADEDDRLISDEEEAGVAELEEQEALAIQKRMVEQLDDQDFGFDIFKAPEKKPEIEPTEKLKIKKDLSKLTKREKLELLKKESPELLDLIADYKTYLREVKDRFYPLQNLVKSGVVPPGKGADYIHNKFMLNLNYCINISFYLMLKAKLVPIHNHPVIARIVQYRNLLKQIEPLDIQMKPQIDLILEKLEKGETIRIKADKEKSGGVKKQLKKQVKFTTAKRTSAKSKLRVRKTKKIEPDAKRRKLSELISSDDDDESGDDGDEDFEEEISFKPSSMVGKSRSAADDAKFETTDEKAALEYYQMMKAGRGQSRPDIDDEGDENDHISYGGEDDKDVEGEEEEIGRRAINKQIEKNKGLTPHRKKEQRNPRVKHRMKFRKAKIRRKGQVREVRTETTRYGGELSGIRAGIKRSIQIKA